jgi:predicted DNA binding CopG/RHH family protein
MREHYDFTKSRKNPYTRGLKRQITIRLDRETVDYFKALAAKMNLPYQTLINMYLRDCAREKRKLTLSWGR